MDVEKPSKPNQTAKIMKEDILKTSKYKTLPFIREELPFQKTSLWFLYLTDTLIWIKLILFQAFQV